MDPWGVSGSSPGILRGTGGFLGDPREPLGIPEGTVGVHQEVHGNPWVSLGDSLGGPRASLGVHRVRMEVIEPFRNVKKRGFLLWFRHFEVLRWASFLWGSWGFLGFLWGSRGVSRVFPDGLDGPWELPWQSPASSWMSPGGPSGFPGRLRGFPGGSQDVPGRSLVNPWGPQGRHWGLLGVLRGDLRLLRGILHASIRGKWPP